MILPSLYKNQPKNKTKTIGTFLPKCLHDCCGRNRSRDLTYGRRVCQYVDIRKHNTLTKARFIRRSLHEPNLIIWFGACKDRRMNQLGSTDLYLSRPAVLFDCASRIERQSLDFDSDVELLHRGYLDNRIDETLSEVNFRERISALQNKQKTPKNILPFVTEYRSSVPNQKQFR